MYKTYPQIFSLHPPVTTLSATCLYEAPSYSSEEAEAERDLLTCPKSRLLATPRAEPSTPSSQSSALPGAPGHQCQPTGDPRKWQFPTALYYCQVAGPVFLRNTYPKYVKILYLVSSSYSTLTPQSVIWFTLSLKQNSGESYKSEQPFTVREHSFHKNPGA